MGWQRGCGTPVSWRGEMEERSLGRGWGDSIHFREPALPAPAARRWMESLHAGTTLRAEIRNHLLRNSLNVIIPGTWYRPTTTHSPLPSAIHWATPLVAHSHPS